MGKRRWRSHDLRKRGASNERQAAGDRDAHLPSWGRDLRICAGQGPESHQLNPALASSACSTDANRLLTDC